MRNTLLCILALLFLSGAPAMAQAIFVDKPVQAGELILFPDISNPRLYYYLPNKVKLGANTDGTPQFSFLRYVQNVKTAPGEETRTEGEGGGIVHTVVQLEVTPEQIADAERELRRKVPSSSIGGEAVIQGPVIYKKGTMALISSAADDKGGFTKSIVGLGPAPIIAGNKAAVSVHLTKLGAKILWESFQTATPDMSFSFVMTVNGFRSPVNARVEADFDRIYQNQTFKAGVSMAYIDASIEAAFDQLRDEGAIKVTGVEASDKMQAIIETTYKKLLDIMFEPMQTNASDPANPAASLASVVGLLSQNQGGASAGGRGRDTSRAGASTFKISFGYKMKEIKKTGKFVLDLNKSMSDELQFRFDENFGKVKCANCFRQVNLDDPLYKQREILLSIDGLNFDQFGKYVNFVTVTMKKMHGNNEATVDEQRIAPKDFANAGNLFRLLYGWKDQADDDRAQWLKYEYKTVWSFFGDYQAVQDWTTTDQVGLNLAPPFHPVEVNIEASAPLLQNAKIRLVTVKFYYDYGAGEKMEQVSIKADDKTLAAKAEFMLKRNQYQYEYEVIWRLPGNKTMTTGRQKSTDTMLYVDEIPEGLAPNN
jgi:hypothetical protein